ncbi:MAG: 2-oxoglutarate dehydrogenase complex dihydrolipoyllysine-residue succinyltransferase [Gammaproteobacteria bacterium AqS3]|nr:2-oxoglutarate dehydrogenase complex dihydrolipoyllysine-residue succinyltransferase [Gammaproteobacteria bacterium AqS3]
MVKAPQFPESVPSGVLLKWLKTDGEAITADEVIAEIETDKVVIEVYAPFSGSVVRLMCQEGDEVISGQDLAVVGEGAGAAPAPQGGDASETASETAAAARPAAAEAPAAGGGGDDLEAERERRLAEAGPAVRKLIAESGLDIAQIGGSGRGGRVTRKDVLDFQKGQGSAPAAAPAPAPSPAPAAPPAPSPDGRDVQREPMTRLRRTIAERLSTVGNHTAMLTTFNEVDLSQIKALRDSEKQNFLDRHGVRLGFMSFFVRASIIALREYPLVNASIEGDDIVYHGYQDVGIAVSSQRGLVVPVLRDAQQLTLAGIERAINDFGERAQAGKLSLDELQGGTFTISNGGVFGSMLSTPILNPPQTAVLGMHNIVDRPVVRDGEIVIRPMMYLALTYDHRLLDGRDAVLFLVRIRDLLETPMRLMLLD